MDVYDVYLHHPFTMLISGPTSSGKTTWLRTLLNSSSTTIKPQPSRIVYFYGEYQPLFSTFKNVEFVYGLQERMLDNLDGQSTVVVIDDLMTESSNSSLISDFFTKGSHHKNVSIILVVQNFFAKGKEMRNITLNCHYIVLFKNPRDKSMATNIARQMYPNKVKKFQSAFNDATSKPYSYLFIDLKPHTPDEIRLMSNVLGEEPVITVYSI